jgi:hypothetical protein
MYLTVSGKPSKVSLKTVEAAVAFYADHLMKNHNKVDLYLDFEDGYKASQGNETDCCCEDKNQFTITVDASMSERATLIALAHEMVHVKQHVYDKFGFNDWIRMYRFGAEHYPEDIEYCNAPWEIEAYDREIGLYIMFKQSQKNK